MQASKQTKFRLKLVLAALCGWIGVALLGPAAGYAQTSTPVASNSSGAKLEVKAGFDGNYKLHEWVPIQVSVAFDKTSGDSIVGRIEASTTNFDRSSPIYTRAVQLTPPARKTFWLYIMGREFGYNLQVRLVRDDGTLITQTSNQLTALSAGVFLMGVVNEDTRALSYLKDTKLAQPVGNYSAFLYDGYGGYGGGNKPGASRGNTPSVTIANLNPADLPPTGAGLSALDGLVFSDLSVSSFAGNTFDRPAIANALASWLGQGKALIVAGDSSLRQSDLFHNLLPVQDDGGPVTLPDLAALQSASHAPSAPTLINGNANFTAAKVKPLTNVPGTIVLSKNAQGLPLVVTRPFGMGQVWFIAPELKPLAGWKDAPILWNWLLTDYQLHFSYASEARHATQTYYNLEDLLPIAQRNDLPDPIALLIFLVVYVLTVGPLNYFILRHFDRRELAWFTIPALTIAFSIGAFVVGSNNGVSDLVISRVNILTVGQGNDGNFSGSSTELASVYSNGRNHFKLQVEPDVLSSHVFEQEYTNAYNFGNRNYGSSNNQSDIIQQGLGGGYPDLNISTRGSRNYAFESDNADKIAGKGLAAQVTFKGGTLSGTIENRTGLEWSDVSVFAGRKVVKLGDLKPGQKVQLGVPTSGGTSLVNQLTDYNTGTSGNSPGYRYRYYQPSSGPHEFDLSQQKATIFESLFGTNGEGLKTIGNTFYVTAWANNLKPTFQPENRTETNNNLTLLFEPLTAS